MSEGERGVAGVTKFAEWALRARQQMALIEEHERKRLVADGVDPEEIEARMDCLRLGAGAMVEGKRVDPMTVRMFVRTDVMGKATPRGRVAETRTFEPTTEWLYRMSVDEDGNVSVASDA